MGASWAKEGVVSFGSEDWRSGVGGGPVDVLEVIFDAVGRMLGGGSVCPRAVFAQGRLAGEGALKQGSLPLS